MNENYLRHVILLEMGNKKANKTNMWYCNLFLSGVFILATGCVMVQPVPYAARAGDTIMLPVGSPDGMDMSNTTITFEPDLDPGNQIDLTARVRSISKVYPDKTSFAWLLSLADSVPTASGHGPWLTVITLDLPEDIPEGKGIIHVSTSNDVVYPENSANVNSVPIDFEILPGQGQPHGFEYRTFSFSTGNVVGDLSKLGSLPQLLVAPPVPHSSEDRWFGAIEFKLNAPIRSDQGDIVPASSIAVVQDDQPDNIKTQVQMSWHRSGDDFTINFMSASGGMRYYQARCSLVVMDPGTSGEIAFPVLPSLTSVRYFDVNGDLVNGPSPELKIR